MLLNAEAPLPLSSSSPPQPDSSPINTSHPQYDASVDATLEKWEVLYPSTTLNSEITLAAGKRVVISGCALGGSLSVGKITIPKTSAVSLMRGGCNSGWCYTTEVLVLAVQPSKHPTH